MSDKKENKKKILAEKDIIFLKKTLPILFILIAIFVAFHVRSGPINLTGIEQQIERNTYSQIQSIISQQIDFEYPNLNPIYKQELIDKEYAGVLEKGSFNYGGQEVQLKVLVEQNTNQVKSSFQADNGQTYLNAIDPYHFLGLSQNYVDNGHTGNTVDELGNPRISYKLAPIGISGRDKPEFHIWIESLMLKMNGLNSSSDIGEKTKAVFLIPVFFAMLSVIPIFFIIRRFSDDLTAFFGSLFLVSIGTFVSRTIAGFVDTDTYNVFFPLVVMAILIYGLVNKDKIISTVLTAISGFFLAMYLWSWSEGWYLAIFILGSLIMYLTYDIILAILHNMKTKSKKDKIKLLDEENKNTLISIGVFLISSFIFTFLITQRNLFTAVTNGFSKSLTDLASISQTNIWPNVLSSVAELNPASFGSIINSVGGRVVFLIALIGLVLITLDYKSKNTKSQSYNKFIIIGSLIWFYLIIFQNTFLSLTSNLGLLFIALLFVPIGVSIIKSLFDGNKSEKIFLVMLLSTWIAGTVYMSLNGVRFILLLAPAFAISFAIGLYYIHKITNELFENIKNIKFELHNEELGKATILAIIFWVMLIQFTLVKLIEKLKVSELTGTIILFAVSIIIIGILISIAKESKNHIRSLNNLFLFLIGLLIGKFIFFLLIGIIFGIGLIILNIHFNEKNINFTGICVMIIIFGALYSPIYAGANAISNGTTPNFDDAWYESMYNIRDNSNENAIITSWWDFGHFFATVGQRGVTFDGASQTTPQSHWVGKLLMENDEKISQDILRMLVCGGNEAHNTMLEYSEGSAADAVKINKLIYETLGKDTSETREILKSNQYYEYSNEQVDNIMTYLSCDEPPQNFVITSQDMIGKSGVWTHWGSWDFTKKYVHDNYKTKTAQEIADDIIENVTLIETYVEQLEFIDERVKNENAKRSDLTNPWFAPYPGYVPIQGKYLYPCEFTNTTISCQNNVDVNIFTGQITSNLGDDVTFRNVILPQQDGTISVIPQGNEDGLFDVVMVPGNGNYQVLLTQAPLGASLFTKLFYLDGYGTTLFEKFDDKQSATGVRIKTWAVNWTQPKEDPLNGISVQNIVFDQ